MSKIELRQASSGDEKILAYIQTESWKAAFRGILPDEDLSRCTDIQKVQEMYKKDLSSHINNLTIEFVDGNPHCIAGWNRNRCGLSDNVAELICIHSLCDNWRKGYGSVMISHIMKEIKVAGYEEIILWVFEKNERAIRFYEKHGFVRNLQKKEINGVVEILYSKKL